MTELTDDEILRRARAIEKRIAETEALEAFIGIRAEFGAQVYIQVKASSAYGRNDRTLPLPDDIVDDVIRKLQMLDARKRLLKGVANGD